MRKEFLIKSLLNIQSYPSDLDPQTYQTRIDGIIKLSLREFIQKHIELLTTESVQNNEFLKIDIYNSISLIETILREFDNQEVNCFTVSKNDNHKELVVNALTYYQTKLKNLKNFDDFIKNIKLVHLEKELQIVESLIDKVKNTPLRIW